MAEAAEESETEVAEAEEESEPEATGTEEERPEPTRVASRSEDSDKKAEAKTETSKEKSSRKQKTKRVVKKIATRVMGHLSRNYDAAMQGAAISVMRMSAPTYKSTELQDLQEWYMPVEMDGGQNYDHPAAMWFAAQAGQDMTELVKLQWQK